jgi:hypothetical protein
MIEFKEWSLIKQILDLYKKSLKIDSISKVSINKGVLNSILHPVKNNNGNTDTEKPTSTKTASE